MKSEASNLLGLLQVVYQDACNKCTADVYDYRDLETLRSRVENEGLSFLTITLPMFSRDFEQALEYGIIDSTLFRSFGKSGSIPAFLQGMTSQVFDRDTGRIYNDREDTSTIIESVRQICLTFKKLEIDCSPERTMAAFNSYIAIEQSLEMFSLPSDAAIFLAVSDILWSDCLLGVNPADLLPKHGPGTTAEGISGNQKYAWQSWHDRLEPYFPLINTAYPLGTPFDAEELKKITMQPEEKELPVRVISVPKTLKSPRIIAIEPVCMQYAQQGVRDALYDAIGFGRFSRGHVNFRDQSVNQRSAIRGSIDGQLATIDLSDASDRVPHELAIQMFRSNPDLRDAIDACRSTRAKMPSGEIVSPLKKFASMGSALCFPVEAMYFYTICVMALLRARDLPVTPRNVFKVSRRVYVYGDDIIVPKTNAVIVFDQLQKYNCKLNLNKTFYIGKFRESCGVDAYMGYEVTPTYVHTLRPENKQQASQLLSWTATANAFYKKGYWQTASFMIKIIERIVGPLPYVSEKSSGLGRFSYLGYCSANRWNSKLQRLEVRCWAPKPIYRTDRLEGYGALMKSFLGMEESEKDSPVLSDTLHLERSALYGGVALTRRWLPSLF